MALFLGAVGLYGVVSYTVGRRTREFGIRIALGARASEIRSLVLRRAAVVTLAGLVVGTAGTLGLTRLLGGLLFGVGPTDPVTFGVAAGLLMAITLLAAYIPARRAAQVDPIEAVTTE